jgi:hypothetical protein
MSENTVAFVFPGQGSQKVGMLADAHQQFQSVRDTFEEASQALGYDMWDLIQNGEQEALNLTETTQPVLLSSSVALWRAWQEQSGTAPAIMAGHSLGEFSALVCAGALGFTDAVGLVRQRGAFMQTAVPVGEGAMAAIIGLDDEAQPYLYRGIREQWCSRVRGELQLPGPGSDSRAHGSGGHGNRGAQGGGGQARDAAAGQRTFPYGIDEARRRAPRRSRTSISARPRCR